MRIRWPCDPVGALALLFVCSVLGACQAFLTLDPETSTAAELGQRMRSETAVWAGVIRDAGIKAQ